MTKLTGKLGEWDLPHVHMWKDRSKEIKFSRHPLITLETRIVIIGSCFADGMTEAMQQLRLNSTMHPTGYFYNTRSIRQEIERIFGEWPEYHEEAYWKTNSGFVHPFKSYYDVHPSESSLKAWSDKLDTQAETLFKKANIIVLILGLTEIWVNPETKNVYRQIPHPDVFKLSGALFHRLTVSEMVDDLSAIRSVLRNNMDVEIIVMVGPTPLHSTMTPLDVRVGNMESKSRVRAAASEFVERYPDVHYFHSYEIVNTAERMSDFTREDGRHIQERATGYISQQLLRMFAADDVPVPTLDTSWITPPLQTVERITTKKKTIRKYITAFITRHYQDIIVAKHDRR